jgi:methylmalonyl-CoA/ethylmalonyl-CoA epimerase
MITIKRLDHLSMAHPDWRAQAAWLERILGYKFLRPFSEVTGPNRPEFDGCVSEVPRTAMEFEIISPIDGGGFVQKYLDDYGPGLHHITLEVEDIHAAAEELTRLGIRPFGGIVDDGEWYVTYIHPKDSGGILWQLFEDHHVAPAVDRTIAHGGVVDLVRTDHVNMAVPDLDRQVEWQQRVLGFEFDHRWRNERQGYDGALMTIPNSKLTFELIAPFRDDSFVARFLQQRRPGMHHICSEVVSVERAVERLREAGIEAFGGVIEGGHWHRHTFIHPRDSGGVLFQLFEEAPS